MSGKGKDKDIFERIYATRLEAIQKQPECFQLVKELDTGELLEVLFNQSGGALVNRNDFR